MKIAHSAVCLMFLAIGALAHAAPPVVTPVEVPAADQRLFESHVRFLADDLLEGREAGSRGFDVAALYVATQLRRFGLKPMGDSGSYLQAVPLRSARLVKDSPTMEIRGRSGLQSLRFGIDFIQGPSLLESQSEIEAPMVFVGYGIQAPRLGHDDFANIDVRGKILVSLAGAPSSFPSEEFAHFRGAHKREVAAKYGAVGIVQLLTPTTETVRPFARVAANVYHFPSMGWIGKDGKPADEIASLQNGAAMSLDGGRKLFSEVETKLDAIFALEAAKQPLPHMDLHMSAHLHKASTLSDSASNNIVGVIEGSDPVLKHEYVVYSAHLDHLGIAADKAGDKIYNGAMDNASGVATLLEAARMFGEGAVKPKRSILFLVLTGEEKGQLGSDYFASNPTVPAEAIVADINLDMPLLTYDFSSIVAFGAEHSSLHENVVRAATRLGVKVMPDPWPLEGTFTRSDQYRFVRHGIPAAAIKTGLSSFRRDEQADKLWADFRSKVYHEAGDDMSQPFNYAAAARFAQINYLIALDVANAPHKPAWKKGDFFGDTFKR